MCCITICTVCNVEDRVGTLREGVVTIPGGYSGGVGRGKWILLVASLFLNCVMPFSLENRK